MYPREGSQIGPDLTCRTFCDISIELKREKPQDLRLPLDYCLSAEHIAGYYPHNSGK